MRMSFTMYSWWNCGDHHKILLCISPHHNFCHQGSFIWSEFKSYLSTRCGSTWSLPMLLSESFAPNPFFGNFSCEHLKIILLATKGALCIPMPKATVYPENIISATQENSCKNTHNTRSKQCRRSYVTQKRRKTQQTNAPSKHRCVGACPRPQPFLFKIHDLPVEARDCREGQGHHWQEKGESCKLMAHLAPGWSEKGHN